MGTLNEDKYHLKWNDFTENFSSAFRELRDDKDFFDVTLVTDADSVRAHKVILGACSPHFRSMLKRIQNQVNPVIYLRGVRHEDLAAILNFMYNGEVNVAQEELAGFLAVAEDLKVKGLTQTNPGGPAEHPAPDARPPPTKKLKQSPTESKKSPVIKTEVDNIDQNVYNQNIDMPDEADIDNQEYATEDFEYDMQAGPGPSSGGEDSKGNGQEEETDNIGLGLAKLPDGTIKCLRCGKSLSTMGNARAHFKSVHLTDKLIKKFKCKICQKAFSIKRYVNNHMLRAHGISQKLLKANIMPTFKKEEPEEE